MSQVTVGVPVYNGAEFLEKSLACLRDQTFRDIEVLIFDNCSDDATPEIAQAFCAQDPRFRYFRQPVNKGPVANFLGASWRAAKTPFFMWRAADDTSDLDYIETLLDLLPAKPERDIAVARIVSALPDGRVTKMHDVSPGSRKGERLAAWRSCLRRIMPAGSTVFSGVKRCCPSSAKSYRDYPHVRGWDNVTMFPLEFDEKSSARTQPHSTSICLFPDRAEAPRNAPRATMQKSKWDGYSWHSPTGMSTAYDRKIPGAPVLSPCRSLFRPQTRLFV